MNRLGFRPKTSISQAPLSNAGTPINIGWLATSAGVLSVYKKGNQLPGVRCHRAGGLAIVTGCNWDIPRARRHLWPSPVRSESGGRRVVPSRTGCEALSVRSELTAGLYASNCICSGRNRSIVPSDANTDGTDAKQIAGARPLGRHRPDPGCEILRHTRCVHRGPRQTDAQRCRGGLSTRTNSSCRSFVVHREGRLQ
jgi:hypothetical protein